MSAGSTAACWRPATWPTSTSSTSTRLGAHPPHIVHDLPAGGRRLMQTAAGYVHTIKRGMVTFRTASTPAPSPAASCAAPSPPPPDRGSSLTRPGWTSSRRAGTTRHESRSRRPCAPPPLRDGTRPVRGPIAARHRRLAARTTTLRRSRHGFARRQGRRHHRSRPGHRSGALAAVRGEGAKVVVNDLGGGTDGSGADSSAAQQVVDEIDGDGRRGRRQPPRRRRRRGARGDDPARHRHVR